MVPPLWVAHLIISEATKEKLAAKHGLDWRDVRDAVVCARGLRYAWRRHPTRGLRVMIEAEVSGRQCVVVLYPVGRPPWDVFALGSAYPRNKRA